MNDAQVQTIFKQFKSAVQANQDYQYFEDLKNQIDIDC